MKTKKLYIIGNGFDLAHELPTSYHDFYEWLKGANYQMDNHNDYSDFVSQMDEIFSHTEDGDPIDLWCDFENALGQLNIGAYIDDIAQEYEVKDPNNEDYKNPSKLAEQVSSYVDYIAKPWALDKVQELFANWVREIPIYEDTDLVFAEDIDKDGIFMTFNYTGTLEYIYKINPQQVFHIHGFASNPDSDIVVGHETTYNARDYDNVEEQLFGVDTDIFPTMVETMNGLRKNTKQIIAANQSWFDDLSTGIQEIYLYGLSFGQIDDEYFREINRQIPNAHWHFAVHAPTKGSEKSSIERIRAFILRIGINKNNCEAFDQDTITNDEIPIWLVTQKQYNTSN